MPANPDAPWMLDRRAAMAMVAAAGLMPTLLRAAPPQDVWPLWSTPPGGGGPAGPVAIDARGAVSNIAVSTITVVRPHRPTGAAMLIAGGGGYKRIEERKEALPAASWLAARGITAFILRYRLPGEGWADGPLVPLQDAQRALRLIRARSGSLGIDPERVGVLGFSAGGHLLGLAATRSNFPSYTPSDLIDRQSARPNLAALIYPVVTLEPPYDRTSTRRVLIGAHPVRRRAPTGRSRRMCVLPARRCFWSRPRTIRFPTRTTRLFSAMHAKGRASRSNCTVCRPAGMASAWASRARHRRNGRSGSNAGSPHVASPQRMWVVAGSDDAGSGHDRRRPTVP